MIEEIVALILALSGAVVPGTLPPPERHDPKPEPSRETSRVVEWSGPSASAWADLRECEAGHLGYRANTGNGYFGAYQFDLQTWQGVGGSGYPHEASPAEQDRRALRLYEMRGAQPWPVCGQYLEEE